MASSKNHYKGYSIQKRNHSFLIRITFNRKTYNYTYQAPLDLTESKQYAAAEKEAIRLRDKIKLGYSSSMPIFKDYISYVLETKKKLSARKSTANQYKYLSKRLIDEFGEDPLDRITPQRLNSFYIALGESETLAPASAIAIPGLLKNFIKQAHITYDSIHSHANVGKNTVSLAVSGTKVSIISAEKICNFLNLQVKDYFYIISNSRPISDKTVQEHINLLSTVLQTAVNERILEFNPVSLSTRPKVRKKLPNYYQPHEVAEIWKKLENEDLRWYVIITLLIVTGCRRGEIAALQWSSILWDYNLLHICREVLYNEDDGLYVEDFTKNVDEKYVQIDSQSMQLLKEYQDHCLNDMNKLGIASDQQPIYCFYQVTNPDKPINPSSINHFLARFSAKYGFKKINPHSLRHSLASALIAEGVDDIAVAHQLGHKQVSTTREIYAHQIAEHQAKVAERIPDIYRK